MVSNTIWSWNVETRYPLNARNLKSDEIKGYQRWLEWQTIMAYGNQEHMKMGKSKMKGNANPVTCFHNKEVYDTWTTWMTEERERNIARCEFLQPEPLTSVKRNVEQRHWLWGHILVRATSRRTKQLRATETRNITTYRLSVKRVGYSAFHVYFFIEHSVHFYWATRGSDLKPEQYEVSTSTTAPA
jgi:hypothetical protein